MKKKISLMLLVVFAVAIPAGCKLFDKPLPLLGTWQYETMTLHKPNGDIETIDYPRGPDSNGFLIDEYGQFTESRIYLFRRKIKNDESTVYLYHTNPLISLDKGEYTYRDISNNILSGTYTISGKKATFTESVGEGANKYMWVIEAKRVADSEVADYISQLP